MSRDLGLALSAARPPATCDTTSHVETPLADPPPPSPSPSLLMALGRQGAWSGAPAGRAAGTLGSGPAWPSPGLLAMEEGSTRYKLALPLASLFLSLCLSLLSLPEKALPGMAGWVPSELTVSRSPAVPGLRLRAMGWLSCSCASGCCLALHSPLLREPGLWWPAAGRRSKWVTLLPAPLHPCTAGQERSQRGAHQSEPEQVGAGGQGDR